MVEFVDYDGRYPCLCFGTLTLCIDGEKVTLPSGCLISGGEVTFDDDWEEDVERGRWIVDADVLPIKYRDYVEDIEECVNTHVPWGCCGGCV